MRGWYFLGVVDEDDERDPTLQAFASRPTGNVVALAVSRARIANELFAVEDRATLGRYHLLEAIGTGGMGTVWGAYDPELDRKVAIKLLKAELASARERMLAEGQALAKLAHPNVVNVFDVGVVDEQVYIVMEWVRGPTLRELVREPRTVREIVAVYRAAGEGLAAAHEAGLVHRDFKPDNAMVGEDGRVRVLDFGLARGGVRAADGSDDTVTRGAGTPRYMAPEQAAGGELTPAADQYAFCVALREALGDRAPAWIQQIVNRGSATDAAARYPSMRELLAALARDPAVIWRRRLLAAAALAAAGGAFAIGTTRASEAPVERCVGAREEIDKIWSGARRDAMSAHLAQLGPYGAGESTRLASLFEDNSKRWVTAHRGACLAHDRGELTPQLYEQHLACLARTSAALGTMIEVVSTATRDRLPDAVAAANGLPAPDGCMTEVRASIVAPPPAAIAARASALGGEIERARVLALAVAPTAIAFAETTAASAVSLGYLPMIARAHLEVGRAHLEQNAPVPAIAALQQASREGLEANEHAIAVEAYALELRLIAGASDADRPANASERLAAQPIMESIAKGLGSTGVLARSVLYNNIGNARMNAGDRAGARAAFTQAIGALAAKPDLPDLARIEHNLALATDDAVERERLSAKAIAKLVRQLGPDHPALLGVRVNGAMLLRHPDQALAALRDPCLRFTKLHPHLTEKATICWFEIGWLAEERGDAAETRAAMSAVGPGSKKRIAQAYLAMLDGKHAEAADQMQVLATELLASKAPSDRLRGATALIVVAISQRELGQRVRAIATLRRAEAVLVDLPSRTWMVLYQRYLARIRANLARLTNDPAKARAAADWYRSAGGYEALVTELDAIGSGAGLR